VFEVLELHCRRDTFAHHAELFPVDGPVGLDILVGFGQGNQILTMDSSNVKRREGI
jgi:hypothetical protein